MADKSLNLPIKEKPKICAIDLEQEIVEALQAKGLHCFSGTLGSQVKVQNSAYQKTHQCRLNFDFPCNLHEYDIVIVDLKTQEPIEYVESEHTPSFWKGSEQITFSSSYPETVFDPQPLSSYFLKYELKDFLKQETLVIVFCSAEERVEYYPIKLTRDGLYSEKPESYSLYEFIPCLKETYNKVGKNVLVSKDIREELQLLLQKYSKNFIYEIVFEHPSEWEKR